MHESISFPNLGINFEHVGKTVTVFGFEIAYYGIIIGMAILIGFAIASAEAKRTGQNPEDYLDHWRYSGGPCLCKNKKIIGSSDSGYGGNGVSQWTDAGTLGKLF